MPNETLSRRPLLAGLASLPLASLPLASLPLTKAGATAGAQVNILQRVLDAGVIRVGVWLTAPPWGGFDQDGTPDGSEVALARFLAQNMSVRLQLIRLEPQDRVRALLTDRCDILAAALPMIPANLQRVAFSIPYGRVSVVFAAPARTPIASLADLADKRVAMAAGTHAAEVAHALLPPGSIAIFAPGAARAIEALLLGEADVAVAYDWQLRDLRLARADLDIIPQQTIQAWDYGLATQLGQPDLIHFLNTFLFLRGNDGTLGDIHARYFGVQPSDRPRFR